ncbi:hypothetical protein FPV67DRAFT_1424154 [Lyophyllum atratum]|nr:hypothetical protein FPV67DRAFT_1424154 [Lyophyllum atratum]
MNTSIALFLATLLAAVAANAVPTQAQVGRVDFQSICLRACFPEKPHCPDGWDAKRLGTCWTCCKDVGFAVNADLVEQKAAWSMG